MKPRFNTARGSADTTLLFTPPFSFPGVTARVFPLRASLNLLRSFCGSYLNVAPICELQPYLPFVFLVVLDYGRMAIEASNLGWVSQHEVFFSVPLGKWKCDPRSGRRTFEGWVVNTPFVFVDNASSLTSGREALGWPKVLATLRPSVEQWLTDPRNPTRLLSLCVKGFGDRDAEEVPLLEIDQRSDQNLSLAPPGFDAVDPLGRLSRLTREAWSATWDAAQLLLGAPLAGFGPQSVWGRAGVLFDSLRQLAGLYQEPGVDALTLKQFRDACDPTLICYQALVQSRLGVSRYNRGGLLGFYNLLQGDTTGGFRLRLHDHPSFPIVASLGLEVAEEPAPDGPAVSVLEPFFPFWMSVDLTYNAGQNLCWRKRGTPWYRGTTPVGPVRRKVPYNTVAGAARQVWSGPFYIPKARWYVFPLPADAPTLSGFVDRYLNRLGKPYRFELWGQHVYMVASQARIFSKVLSAAWMEAREISFYVPLVRHQNNQPPDFMMAKPFAFVDNPTLAMSLREVAGIPVVDAKIENAAQFWRRKGPVLKMAVDVFTSLDAGLPSERRTLLELVRAPAAQIPSSSLPFEGSSYGQSRELDRRSLDLPLVTLKQFRDAEQPNRACYQDLIFEEWTFARPRKIERLEPGMAIKIYRYPSLPLADTLGLNQGLVPGLNDSPMLLPREMGGAIAYFLVPDNPFRIELDIHISRGGQEDQVSRERIAREVGSHAELLRDGPQAWIQAFLREHAGHSGGGPERPGAPGDAEPRGEGAS